MDGILRGGGCELILRKSMTKNAQGSARMGGRCNDQHTVYTEWLKASVDVVGLSKRGKRSDRTQGNPFFLRERTGISVGDFSAGLIVDRIARFHIQKHSRSHALAKQFDGTARANGGFTRQHDDGVGVLRSVYHQKASGLTGEGNKNEEQDQHYTDSHATRMLLRKQGAVEFDYASNHTFVPRRKNTAKSAGSGLESPCSMLEFCLDL
jgi:hypothetical protein